MKPLVFVAGPYNSDTLIVPQRIQLSRRKGFRLHEASRNPNGTETAA